MKRDISRREALGLIGTGIAGGLAGCYGSRDMSLQDAIDESETVKDLYIDDDTLHVEYHDPVQFSENNDMESQPGDITAVRLQKEDGLLDSTVWETNEQEQYQAVDVPLGQDDIAADTDYTLKSKAVGRDSEFLEQADQGWTSFGFTLVKDGDSYRIEDGSASYSDTVGDN